VGHIISNTEKRKVVYIRRKIMFKGNITYQDKGIDGMGAESTFYGPPKQGQSFEEYETYMNVKNIAIGGGIVALSIVNPIIGGAAAIGWLLSGPTKTKNKAKTQGG
jgi:hypothetical protein